ncbi:MAG: hypothetical protein AAFR16_07850 [Pseudomonadota bacterium]
MSASREQLRLILEIDEIINDWERRLDFLEDFTTRSRSEQLGEITVARMRRHLEQVSVQTYDDGAKALDVYLGRAALAIALAGVAAILIREDYDGGLISAFSGLMAFSWIYRMRYRASLAALEALSLQYHFDDLIADMEARVSK